MATKIVDIHQHTAFFEDLLGAILFASFLVCGYVALVALDPNNHLNTEIIYAN